MRNKIFTKIIITTLLVTFLTFNVGRVTRVSAVGTVATVACTALLATGVIYMSYLALTGAEMRIPVADDIELWLKDIGTKVVQYPSGASAYQELYEYYSIQDPIANVIDGVWSWTEDKLKSFANDFSDTRLISNIVGYEYTVDSSVTPLNGFDYSFDFVVPNPVVKSYNGMTVNQPLSSSWPAAYFYDGPCILTVNSAITYAVIEHLNTSYQLRNFKKLNGKYIVQYYNNDSWQLFNISTEYGGVLTEGRYFAYNFPIAGYNSKSSPFTISLTSEYDYPVLTDSVIHDESTDQDLPMVSSSGYQLPNWIDPDNDNRPIIPWVPIPDLPTTIDVPSGYIGIDQWGFNLEDLLDNLSELGESIFDLAVLKELINSFAGLHGDQYYLYYDNGDTNYYTYYQPTIYEGDYITYNYDISNHEDTMPVNLNEIQLYTDNRYLEQIKESAIAGSSMLRDLAVFWHDVDPEITYIVLGCCILVLIGAFTGKLGHS